MRLIGIGAAALAMLIQCWLPPMAGADAPARLVAIETPRFRPAEIRIALPRPRPYRSFVLTDPPRLVVDIESALEAPAGLARRVVTGYRAGALGGGWSRAIFDLDRPMVIGSVTIGTEAGGDHLRVMLEGASAAEMARAARAAPGPEVLSDLLADPPPVAPGRLRIVLDPGHGGVDPGAIRDGVAEKDIALAFAHELQRQLQATGSYDVLMTRTDDRFIALDDRVAFARAAGAVLFLSLHANTVAESEVSGAAVHMPSRIASDPASAAMAVMENASDSVGGAGAAASGDDVALTLLDMAEPVTRERARRAASEMVAALRDSTGVIRSRPLRSADFRVLRAPDMPSLLLELGFLSHQGDLAKMQSPAWRTEMAAALTEAIGRWIAADAALLALMRN